MDESIREALKAVPDSYEDFVEGVLTVSKQNNLLGEMEKYIRDNPQADSSAVTGYLFEALSAGEGKWDDT